MNYLTLASMIRNEEHYVQEWLTFHYIQGFEQFVIVLHKCDDKTEAKIRALPFSERIRIHKIISDTQFAQMSTFVWIAEHYGKSTEWLLFCDGDEYVFGTETDDFREVLAHYEEFGGLFVNWQEYGHGNHIDRPKELCIEAFIQRAPADSWWHKSGKSIVKPGELLCPYAPVSEHDPLNYSFLSPHLFRTNKPTVHTDFTPVSYKHWWCTEHLCLDAARCNHYRFRSKADWIIRCERSQCSDAAVTDKDSVDHWEQGGNWSIEDTAAVRFAERVKEVLGR